MKMKKWRFGLASVATILTMAGCSPDNSSNATYTYNTYLSSSPSTWNVHNWETSDESYITSFTEMGLYDAVLNSTKDGYDFVAEMASDMPTSVDPSDVTDEEIENYYSDQGNLTTNQVWDIPLNEKATWEDGRPIKADDYVNSMERLLNPKYANYRADSFYDGNLILVNAEDYYKQGRQTIEPFYGNYSSSTGKVKDDSGFYFLNLGKYTPYVASVFNNADSSTTFYSVLNQVGSTYGVELECQRIIIGYSYYLWKGVDHTSSSNKNDWERVKEPSSVSSTMIEENNGVNLDIDVFNNGFKEIVNGQETGNTLKILTIKELNKGWITDDLDNTEEYTTEDLQDDLKAVVKAIGRSRGDTSKSWAWRLPLFTYVYTYTGAKIEMSQVGIAKIDDYKIRLYLQKACTPLNLKFALTGNWLVNVDLYDRLTRNLGNGSVATTYASGSVDNYMSYGPYKLSYFETGKEIKITRNDNWYGYTDGKHENQFQMEEIDTKIYSDHNTALNEFFAGRLDDIDLTVSDVREYGASGRCTTTYESYTQKISFNTNRDKLVERQGTSKSVNKTILANDDFRKGLSLGMNRTQFAAQATSGSKGFTGLLNDLYLANNATGESYRSTSQGKSVYNMVYGHLGGEEINETNGEALPESATGYNHALAIKYITRAIETELASTKEGRLKAGDTIDIEFRVYDDTSENTIAAHDFIKSTWTELVTEAVKQVKADGKLNDSEDISLELSMIKDQDYYTTARNGGYDMIFSTWGGAAVNPYGLMEVYCKSDFDNCCEYGFKGKQAETKIGIDANGDGVIDTTSEVLSFDKWYDDLNNSDAYNEAKYGDSVDKDDPNYEAWLEVHNKKLNVLAGLEAGIINRFEAVPLVARGSSSLLGFKVEYATDTYVSLIGYGGIRFMTFNYTNNEWSQFCKENGNNLASAYKAWQKDTKTSNA